MALTYYRPHFSGLTIYVERLAKALVRRGHRVSILTSRFSPELPKREIVDGVEIIRPRVVMRISKGVIMPSLPAYGWRLIRQADIINVHLPQLDAAYLALQARLAGKPVAMTYHCDLRLPSGFIHQMANLGSSLANLVTASASHVIITNTRDYAENSQFLKKYLEKIFVIPPSVEMPDITAHDLDEFKRKYELHAGQKVIGMLARLATEKGVEVLVHALPLVLEHHPEARVLYAGQYLDVLGEEAYFRRLLPSLLALGKHWKFLGVIPPIEAAAFFQVCDVTVLPSLNSTESFGMVQVESMISGTPAIASDLPGVRQPVKMTGMGRVVPAGNARALADAIISVLDHPEVYQQDIGAIRIRFSPDTIAREYENLFVSLLDSRPEFAAKTTSDHPGREGQD